MNENKGFHNRDLVQLRKTKFFPANIESSLGWFTAYLAIVFLTKLQGPISPRSHVITLILTMHLTARYARMSNSISLHLKISIFFDIFRFSPIPVILNMPFWDGYNLWSAQNDQKLCFILVPNSGKFQLYFLEKKLENREPL